VAAGSFMRVWTRDSPSWAASTDGDERVHLEYAIAYARLVVSLATLAASLLDPEATGVLSRLAAPVLIAYSVYALSVVLVLHVRREAGWPLGPVAHGFDLFWAAAVTSVTGGASSHCSPQLYVFVLFAAAFRWSLYETLISGVIATALLGTQAVMALTGLLGTPLRPGDLLMRSVWLMLVAALLGYLADRGKRLRAESDLLARISRLVSVDASLDVSVRAVVAELARALDAETTVLVMEDPLSGESMSWAVGHSRRHHVLPLRRRLQEEVRG
jgi:hypothetical protein